MSGKSKLLAVALAIAALVIAIRFLPFAEWVESFNAWVAELGVAGMVVFAFAYAAATVFMLPGAVLTLAGGAAFGLGYGFVTISVGSTLGAALAFLVSRFFARKRIESWIQSKPSFRAIDKAVGEQGTKIVFLTRLSPVFPFNFQNYAYGLTKIPFVSYVAASWVGMIPGTFLYVYLGTLGRSGLEAASGAGNDVESARLALQVVGLAATLLVTILITRTAKKALREAGV